MLNRHHNKNAIHHFSLILTNTKVALSKNFLMPCYHQAFVTASIITL